MAIKIKIVKNDFDEFEVQWIENGKKNEAKTYYTDDEDDAIMTRAAMRKEANQKTICSVCQTPNTDGTFYCQTCGNEIK